MTDWVSREYVGADVYKSPGEDVRPDWDGWEDYLEDRKNVWSLDDDAPSPGDWMIIQTLLGFARCWMEDGGHVTDGANIWWIRRSDEQENDDRNCWICVGGGNLRAIQKLTGGE